MKMDNESTSMKTAENFEQPTDHLFLKRMNFSQELHSKK